MTEILRYDHQLSGYHLSFLAKNYFSDCEDGQSTQISLGGLGRLHFVLSIMIHSNITWRPSTTILSVDGSFAFLTNHKCHLHVFPPQ